MIYKHKCSLADNMNLPEPPYLNTFSILVLGAGFCFCLCRFLLIAYLSRVMRKPTFWFPTWSDTNKAVQLQKMAGCLEISGLESRGIVVIYVAKTKVLISFAVTAKLMCVFVFAYAKRWFSYDAAQFLIR